MNPEIKAKWLEALRSGKYKQGQRRLRMGYDGEDHFCCLGVLCDIMEPKQWVADKCMTGFFTHDEGTGYPSPRIEELAGLDHEDDTMRLARLNDHGVPFSEIADMIEKSL